MIVQRFVQWSATANVQARCHGVELLARAYVEGHVPAEQRDEAHGALLVALEDPSPKVRMVLAKVLGPSQESPRAVVMTLAEDIEEIASLVVAQSPVLCDHDLVDLAAGGTCALQRAIAGRPLVCAQVSAAIAEVGTARACATLLANEGAQINAAAQRRMAERYGDDSGLRAALLDRVGLPSDVRQVLTLQLGHAFAQLSLLRHSVGDERTDRLVAEACERSLALQVADVPSEEIPAFIEHLRVSGQISTAFLIRMACAGHIDVFAATIVALSGTSERRVRAIIVDGREQAFHALIAACGLPRPAAEVLRGAMLLWKRAVAGSVGRLPDDVSGEVIADLVERFAPRREEGGFQRIFAMLIRLETEALRQTARRSARLLAAA